VENAVAAFDIGGTNNANVVGEMAWTNSLTGSNGTFAAVSPWSVPGVDLGTGVNDITVRATNDAGTVATDAVRVFRKPAAWPTRDYVVVDTAQTNCYDDGAVFARPGPGSRPGPKPGSGPKPGLPISIPAFDSGSSGNSSGSNSGNNSDSSSEDSEDKEDGMKYRKELAMAILSMAATGAKPDKAAVDKLVATLVKLSRDGHISDSDMGTFKHYLKKTLRSANISYAEIRDLEKLVEKSAREANLTDDQRKALVSRMSAVARSVQAKQINMR